MPKNENIKVSGNLDINITFSNLDSQLQKLKSQKLVLDIQLPSQLNASLDKVIQQTSSTAKAFNEIKSATNTISIENFAKQSVNANTEIKKLKQNIDRIGSEMSKMGNKALFDPASATKLSNQLKALENNFEILIKKALELGKVKLTGSLQDDLDKLSHKKGFANLASQIANLYNANQQVISSTDQISERYTRAKNAIEQMSPAGRKYLSIQQQMVLAAFDSVRAFQGLKDAGAVYDFLNNRAGTTTQTLFSQGIAIGKLNTQIDKTGKIVNQTISQSGKIYGAITGGTKALVGRIATWATGMMAFYGTIRLVKDSLKILDDVEMQLAQMRIVMDETTTNFDTLTEAAVNMATKYGVALGDTLKAMVVFAQQGLTQNEVINLTEASLLASNVTTLKAFEATELLTAATKQFKLSADDAISVVDKWTNVAARNAVTAKVLADATKRVGVSARLAGIDIDFFNGIVTSIGAATRQSGDEIGTSLRYIFRQFKLENAIKALQDVGIAVYSTGSAMANIGTDFRSTKDVIEEMAASWKGMSDMQQENIALALGGRRHYNSVKVLMENWDDVVKAQIDSQNSWGSAMTKNEVIMQTFSKTVQLMKNEFTALVVSLGNSGGLTSILDMLKMAVSTGGALINVFMTLLGPFKALIGPATGLLIAMQSISVVASRLGLGNAFAGLVGSMKASVGLGTTMLAQLSGEAKLNTVINSLMKEKITYETVELKVRAHLNAFGLTEFANQKAIVDMLSSQLLIEKGILNVQTEQVTLGSVLANQKKVNLALTGQLSAAESASSLKGAGIGAASFVSRAFKGETGGKEFSIAFRTAAMSAGMAAEGASKASAAFGVVKTMLGGVRAAAGALLGTMVKLLPLLLVGGAIYGIVKLVESFGKANDSAGEFLKTQKSQLDYYNKILSTQSQLIIQLKKESDLRSSMKNSGSTKRDDVENINKQAELYDKIAEKFPTLVVGYNEYGKAILDANYLLADGSVNIEKIIKESEKLTLDAKLKKISVQIEYISKSFKDMYDRTGFLGIDSSAIQDLKEYSDKLLYIRKQIKNVKSGKNIEDIGRMEDIIGIGEDLASMNLSKSFDIMIGGQVSVFSAKFMSWMKEAEQAAAAGFEKYKTQVSKKINDVNRTLNDIISKAGGGLAFSALYAEGDFDKEDSPLARIFNLYQKDAQLYFGGDSDKAFQMTFTNFWGRFFKGNEKIFMALAQDSRDKLADALLDVSNFDFTKVFANLSADDVSYGIKNFFQNVTSVIGDEIKRTGNLVDINQFFENVASRSDLQGGDKDKAFQDTFEKIVQGRFFIIQDSMGKIRKFYSDENKRTIEIMTQGGVQTTREVSTQAIMPSAGEKFSIIKQEKDKSGSKFFTSLSKESKLLENMIKLLGTQVQIVEHYNNLVKDNLNDWKDIYSVGFQTGAVIEGVADKQVSAAAAINARVAAAASIVRDLAIPKLELGEASINVERQQLGLTVLTDFNKQFDIMSTNAAGGIQLTDDFFNKTSQSYKDMSKDLELFSRISGIKVNADDFFPDKAKIKTRANEIYNTFEQRMKQMAPMRLDTDEYNKQMTGSLKKFKDAYGKLNKMTGTDLDSTFWEKSTYRMREIEKGQKPSEKQQFKDTAMYLAKQEAINAVIQKRNDLEMKAINQTVKAYDVYINKLDKVTQYLTQKLSITTDPLAQQLVTSELLLVSLQRQLAAQEQINSISRATYNLFEGRATVSSQELVNRLRPGVVTRNPNTELAYNNVLRGTGLVYSDLIETVKTYTEDLEVLNSGIDKNSTRYVIAAGRIDTYRREISRAAQALSAYTSRGADMATSRTASESLQRVEEIQNKILTAQTNLAALRERIKKQQEEARKIQVEALKGFTKAYSLDVTDIAIFDESGLRNAGGRFNELYKKIVDEVVNIYGKGTPKAKAAQKQFYEELMQPLPMNSMAIDKMLISLAKPARYKKFFQAATNVAEEQAKVVEDFLKKMIDLGTDFDMPFAEAFKKQGFKDLDVPESVINSIKLLGSSMNEVMATMVRLKQAAFFEKMNLDLSKITAQMEVFGGDFKHIDKTTEAYRNLLNDIINKSVEHFGSWERIDKVTKSIIFSTKEQLGVLEEIRIKHDLIRNTVSGISDIFKKSASDASYNVGKGLMDIKKKIQDDTFGRYIDNAFKQISDALTRGSFEGKLTKEQTDMLSLEKIRATFQKKQIIDASKAGADEFVKILLKGFEKVNQNQTEEQKKKELENFQKTQLKTLRDSAITQNVGVGGGTTIVLKNIMERGKKQIEAGEDPQQVISNLANYIKDLQDTTGTRFDVSQSRSFRMGGEEINFGNAGSDLSKISLQLTKGLQIELTKSKIQSAIKTVNDGFKSIGKDINSIDAHNMEIMLNQYIVQLSKAVSNSTENVDLAKTVISKSLDDMISYFLVLAKNSPEKIKILKGLKQKYEDSMNEKPIQQSIVDQEAVLQNLKINQMFSTSANINKVKQTHGGFGIPSGNNILKDILGLDTSKLSKKDLTKAFDSLSALNLPDHVMRDIKEFPDFLKRFASMSKKEFGASILKRIGGVNAEDINKSMISRAVSLYNVSSASHKGGKQIDEGEMKQVMEAIKIISTVKQGEKLTQEQQDAQNTLMKYGIEQGDRLYDAFIKLKTAADNASSELNKVKGNAKEMAEDENGVVGTVLLNSFKAIGATLLSKLTSNLQRQFLGSAGIEGNSAYMSTDNGIMLSGAGTKQGQVVTQGMGLVGAGLGKATGIPGMDIAGSLIFQKVGGLISNKLFGDSALIKAVNAAKVATMAYKVALTEITRAMIVIEANFNSWNMSLGDLSKSFSDAIGNFGKNLDFGNLNFYDIFGVIDLSGQIESVNGFADQAYNAAVNLNSLTGAADSLGEVFSILNEHLKTFSVFTQTSGGTGLTLNTTDMANMAFEKIQSSFDQVNLLIQKADLMGPRIQAEQHLADVLKKDYEHIKHVNDDQCIEFYTDQDVNNARESWLSQQDRVNSMIKEEADLRQEIINKISENKQAAVDFADQMKNYAKSVNDLRTQSVDSAMAWNAAISSISYNLNGLSFNDIFNNLMDNFGKLSSSFRADFNNALYDINAVTPTGIEASLNSGSPILQLDAGTLRTLSGDLVALMGDQITAVASFDQSVAEQIGDKSVGEIIKLYKEYQFQMIEGIAEGQKFYIESLISRTELGFASLSFTAKDFYDTLSKTFNAIQADMALVVDSIKEAVEEFRLSAISFTGEDFLQRFTAGENIVDLYANISEYGTRAIRLFEETARGQVTISQEAKNFYQEQAELISAQATYAQNQIDAYAVLLQRTFADTGASATYGNIVANEGVRILTANELRAVTQEIVGAETPQEQAQLKLFNDFYNAYLDYAADADSKVKELIDIGKEANDLLNKLREEYLKEFTKPTTERLFAEENLRALRNMQHSMDEFGNVIYTSTGEVNRVSEVEFRRMREIDPSQQIASTLEEFDKLFGSVIQDSPQNVSTYTTVKPITQNFTITIDAEFLDASQLTIERQRSLALMIKKELELIGSKFSSKD